MHLRATALFTLLLAAGACHVAPPWEPTPALRVLVYNIHAGKDAGGVNSVDRIADVVKRSNADIVLLQEVDQGTRRSGNVDQPAVLEQKTGRHVFFGASLDHYDGGRYGIAVLSRWPITGEVMRLPVDPPQERSGGSYEPRIALVTKIDAPQGTLRVINTHLDASGTDQYRSQEIRTVISTATRLQREPGARVIVGGDFNSTPESDVQVAARQAGLRDAWRQCGVGEAFTYPADVPRKRIDYLMLTGKASCDKALVLDSQASDHRPVLFEVHP